MKNYQNFSEMFSFLVVKFSTYLNRRIFVHVYNDLQFCHDNLCGPRTYVCFHFIHTNVVQSEKTCLLLCAPNEDSN